MWKAIRCALLGPTPGSLPNSSMRSWTTPSYTPSSNLAPPRGGCTSYEYSVAQGRNGPQGPSTGPYGPVARAPRPGPSDPYPPIPDLLIPELVVPDPPI